MKGLQDLIALGDVKTPDDPAAACEAILRVDAAGSPAPSEPLSDSLFPEL